MAFIYKPYKEIRDKYDFKKYLSGIEKAEKESVELIGLAYDYIFEDRNLSVFASHVYNISFNGKPLIYREERLAFKKAYKEAKTVK